MAPPAAERAGRAAAIWRAIVTPSPERIEFSLRIALICALTTLVAETYQTLSIALTAYIVFFLNRPDRTSSLVFNVAFTVIITIVIALVLGIAILVINEPALRVAAMAMFSLAMLFMASASKLKPLAGIMALIVAYALDVLGNIPASELATRGLLYAWLFVGIPAGVSIVVNLLIAPAPRRLAERALARRLRLTAAMLRAPGIEQRRAFAAELQDGTGEILARLKFAGIEKTSPPRDIAALVEATYASGTLLFLTDAIERSGDAPEDWRQAAAATLEEMAHAFDMGGYPVGIELAPLTAGPVAPLTAEFAETLTHFTDPPAEQPPASPKAKGGFFLPDAFTNPDHMRYALKTTAAAMLCYLYYSLTDWPGIHTCLITCYIVSLGTTAETVEKLSLRILGAMIGAAAGLAAIIWVVPALESIGGLMIVVFLGALAGAWISAGSPRISYAGFQIAFAFFLCVIQGNGPAFDLALARDRVVGILVGNLVVYVIATGFWPVSISRRIDPAIAALLHRLSEIARAATPAIRRRALPALQASANALRSDLLIAHYEPDRLQPDGDWLDRRQRALKAVGRLEGPLLLTGADLAVADRLERMAARMAPAADGVAGPTGETLPAKTAPANDILQARLNEELTELEQALG